MVSRKEALSKKPYLPSGEDLEYRDIKELSDRLQEDSDVKTLTNILEWQERNIWFWSDRWHMYLIFLIMGVLSLLIGSLLVIALSTIGIIKIALLVLFVLLSLLLYSNIYVYLVLQIPILSSFFIVLWLLYRKYPEICTKVTFLYYLIGLTMILGGIISSFSYLAIKYRTINIPNFKLVDTFWASLPVEKILKYRLAVCRDYAKLTAALLVNIYPENEIYFITIPDHVATGIKIENKIYILDQKLPVTTLEKWINYWKSRKKWRFRKATILKAVYQDGGIKIEEKCKRKVKNLNIPTVDVESLRKKLLEELGIEKMATSNKLEKFKSIRLNDIALQYEKDEIVEYSMIWAFKNKIIHEFCGNTKKITDVEVQQDDKDIILRVYYY